MWCRRTHCWPLLLLYLSVYICKSQVSMIKRWCIDIARSKHEDIHKNRCPTSFKDVNKFYILLHICNMTVLRKR
jgi:hypothetical protein